MARPNQEAIDTFMSITGAPEPIAVQKLEEYGGDLNAAVNAHFSEGDTNMHGAHGAPIIPPEGDIMDVDDPVEIEPPRLLPRSLLSGPGSPFSLLDPNFRRRFFGGVADFTTREPFVSHPREVREIPIEVRDENGPSSNSRRGPIIEDVTETAQEHGPVASETVIVDEVDDDLTAQAEPQNDSFRLGSVRPSAPAFGNLHDGNDIEEEMIRAAIEASKRELEEFGDNQPQHNASHMEDPEIAEVVSLSLQTAEQEKALREQGLIVGGSEARASLPAEEKLGEMAASNERPGAGSSSIREEAEDVEEPPLVRHRSQRSPSRSFESSQIGAIEANPPSNPGQEVAGNQLPHNENGPTSEDEWGGISSQEHDEAVMLEAAMFGGIPDGGYRFAYAPHQFMQPGASYPRPPPRPPSPSLEAQRLIREQQDDEYLAALQADREKAEARQLEAEAARKAALEEERQKQEEARRKMEEEQEFERLLAAKEASLPEEPAADNEIAITLLVRMPDGSRRGRRFLKSDRLQSLFDFIDIGRAVKPGTYRLVRPYPRRAFSEEEHNLTLNELGLSSKQEALFLEPV